MYFFSAWGLAAVAAYKAYGDSQALAWAKSMWSVTNESQIQPDVWYFTGDREQIPTSCNGSMSVPGVVYVVYA